ncbi:MAG: DedA family protein [Thiohalocapsa sp.]|jgi:membrane protein YqaA with SNARE-associated domain|uniref:YqaA family protein n=1 Tax=Thiohalocapsa sp. TaxID=2497641 RepID=UPI0025DB0015|nr:YqaA family protein [Thiohalocapsa sp.]MCG6943575.1 DedA family protein [Thiohalocapsa sp.]
MEGYLGLFTAAFVAATLLPFYSELALVGLLAAGYDPWLLWLWATAGNTLGAAVNYVLGRWLMHWQDRPWFPFKPEQLGPARRWYARWGIWSLLMAWLPVGGDALTFIAGLMRAPFWLFFLLTAAGKGGRYALVLVLYTLGAAGMEEVSA